MKIGVVGIGYVGLVCAAGFAHMGNNVICVDIDEDKINRLKKADIPIFETGLQDLIKLSLENANISFSTSINHTVENTDVIFITVGTPASIDGSADLKYVLDVACSIALAMEDYKLIVIKSTVPVGTCFKVYDAISDTLKKRNVNIDFDVISNPEFLKEGHAIEDFMKPDRIIIGSSSPKANDIIKKIYAPFMRNKSRIIFMDVVSAEMTKYAANAILATKISFMNQLARLCDKTNADIDDIRLGIGADKRIGPHFIYAGIGFGGSCFPKDVRALINTGFEHEEDMSILKAVLEVNISQKQYFINKVIDFFGQQNLQNLTFAVWGLAFKADTDDIRESPAIDIISTLACEFNSKINAFDPIAIEHAKKVIKSHNVSFYKNQYEVLKGSDALLILTDWKLFREPNFNKIKTLMRKHVIFDGRNHYEPKHICELGFTYFAVGRRIHK